MMKIIKWLFTDSRIPDPNINYKIHMQNQVVDIYKKALNNK